MRKSPHADFLALGDILVSGDIITEYFCCDYAACKGACCVFGDSGAPLEEGEADALEKNYPHYEALMTDCGRAAVRDTGFVEIDRDGDAVTPVVRCRHREGGVTWALGDPGLEDCAFCHYEPDGSCWCAVERQFLQGKGDFQKPISCALYPIRVTVFKGGGRALNMHRQDLCRQAFEKGRREGIRVYEFLRGPLSRAFGEDFYSALCEAARSFIAAS